MIHKNILVVALLSLIFNVFITVQARSDQNETNIIIGKSYELSSDILGETRRIQISLPDGYDKNTADKYSVVYVIDGQWYFPYVVGLQTRLRATVQSIPPLIIVGLEMGFPSRFGWLRSTSAKADQFLGFIEKEVMPFVETNFRTNNSRILMGWEYGGGFTMHTLANRPQLFDAYIASSPFPLEEAILDTLSAKFTTQPDLEKFLFFGVTEKEGMVSDGVDRLVNLLQKSTPEKFTWDHRIYGDGEPVRDHILVDHVTSAFPTFRAGLRTFYSDYAPLDYRQERGGIAKLREQGGVSFVKDHFARRNAKYGASPDVYNETMFAMFRLAMDEGDLPFFLEMKTAFKSYYDNVSPNRAKQYADFIAKHQKDE